MNLNVVAEVADGRPSHWSDGSSPTAAVIPLEIASLALLDPHLPLAMQSELRGKQ